MKNKLQQTKAAKQFVQNWLGHKYEKGEAQKFWIDLLTNVFGVKDIANFIFFEERVKDKIHNKTITNYIDGYIPATRVMIENKSGGQDLQEPILQSDGTLLTPFQQAKKYVAELPLSQHPKWIVTFNFEEFQIYDMENPIGEPQRIFLKDLEKECYRLRFLVDDENDHLKRELEVSVKATELVGRIYDKLLEQYIDKTDAEALRSLNVLCVRLVFCLYAEDAVLFASKTAFHDYLARFEPRDIRRALIDLFQTLDTPVEQRDKYLDETLAQFPYVNGGLFGHDIVIPQFTDEIKQLLLGNASADFDWSEISPTIFGALFESTLNPDTRRKGGMHYTSIENIHKVIDPLFMEELQEEFHSIVETGRAHSIQKRNRQLFDFQKKIASLTFLDPACGSGNFLTETYMSLRRLENEVIMEMTKGQVLMGFEEVNPVKVSIHQFYGIEINDFAVDVAKTALWIAENQMLQETEKIIDRDLEMLPLKSYSNIRKGNALHTPWHVWEVTENHTVVIAQKTNIFPMTDAPASEAGEPTLKYGTVDLYSDEINLNPTKKPTTYYVDFDYIMGNPPFVGYTYQTKEQKEDTLATYLDYSGKPYKSAGKIDYVANWYFKAAQLIQNKSTKCAFVSTNSITQGEQVAALWKPLLEQFKIHIDFAYRAFRWDSESEQKAHVHCVIIGFSREETPNHKRIFLKDNIIEASNINPYLLDAPTVFIENRKKPICDVPEMQKGSIPVDGGNLIIEENEYADFIKKNPLAQQFVFPLLGADEFISGKKRYCLWLIDANPSIIKQCPGIMERLRKVREMRLASSKASTRQFADFPTRFMEIRQPDTDYLLIPSTTSENRQYIPIGYLNKNIITTNANFTITNASIYHFGILTSKVHNAWMRAVGGRLKSDYRYSNTIVYNNFPWPDLEMRNEKSGMSKSTKESIRTPNSSVLKIEQTAQAILDARAKYPDSSLADLYDPFTMPPELRKAHEANDKAVMQAYGFNSKMTEDEIVAELFKLYQKLTKQ